MEHIPVWGTIFQFRFTGLKHVMEKREGEKRRKGKKKRRKKGRREGEKEGEKEKERK